MKRVKSPDGREWEVRASRFRLALWRENDFDPWNYTTGVLDGLFAFLVLLPVFMVVVPIATGSPSFLLHWFVEHSHTTAGSRR